MSFQDKSPGLKCILDMESSFAFGMKVSHALENDLCVSCHKKLCFDDFSVLGIKEWKISGLCPKCYNEITGVE